MGARLYFCFARTEELKYLSHLDLLRLLQRALRRTSLPLAYSEGYNPHPRFSLAVPLPVGVTADGEYGELFLKEPVSPEHFKAALSAQLPPGLELKHVAPVGPAEPSLASRVNAAAYLACWSGTGNTALDATRLVRAVEQLLNRQQILIERQKKDKITMVDIRPYLFKLEVVKQHGQPLQLEMLLQTGSSGGVSPWIVLAQIFEPLKLKDQAVLWRLHRRGLYVYRNGAFRAPFSKGGD